VVASAWLGMVRLSILNALLNSRAPVTRSSPECGTGERSRDRYCAIRAVQDVPATVTIGSGKVYERALVKELRLRGMRVDAQAAMDVSYKGESLGTYLADLVVEGELVVELKCADRLGADHTAQCLNYLRASGREVCLLVNFQSPRVEWKRILRPAGWASLATDENG
jgi:GxxExxY protein